MKKNILIVFAILGCYQFLSSSFSYASDENTSIGYTVSPAIIELTGKPGESFSSELTFQNLAENPTTATVTTDSLIPIDNIIDQGKRSQFDASSWIDVPKPNLIFDAGDLQTLKFNVSIPENANPGGHYAFINLRSGVVARADSSKAKVAPQLGVSVFITVEGEVNEIAEIVQSDLEISNLVRGTNNEISFRVRNLGNVHILTSPKVSISRSGERIESINVPAQLILPNTEKTFTAEWNADVSFGKYELTAEMTYGSQSIPLASIPTSFYVTPSIGLILLIILVVPLLAFAIIRYKNIPKVIQVLKGNANLSSGKFKASAGSENLPKIKTLDNRPINELAEELNNDSKKPSYTNKYYPPINTNDEHTTPTFIGKDTDSEPINKQQESKQQNQTTQNTVSKEPTEFANSAQSIDDDTTNQAKPHVSSTTILKTDEHTTFITQTSASTIIREQSPTFNPMPNNNYSKTIKINVKTQADSSIKPSTNKPTSSKEAPTKSIKKASKKPKKSQKTTKSKVTKQVKNKVTKSKKISKNSKAKKSSTDNN